MIYFNIYYDKLQKKWILQETKNYLSYEPLNWNEKPDWNWDEEWNEYWK